MVIPETLVESRKLLWVWNYQWKLACRSTFLFDSFSIRVIWTIWRAREIIPHPHPFAVSPEDFIGRRVWAMYVTRKWGLFPFNSLDDTNFELFSVFTLLEAICWKNVEQNHSPNMEKVHLRFTCVAQKHLYFRFSLFSNATRARRALRGKKGYLSIKRLYHSREFKQKLIKWWSILGVLQGRRLFEGCDYLKYCSMEVVPFVLFSH